MPGVRQVIARDREDMDARWDRAMLFAEIGESKKALAAFEAIAAARPSDSEVWPPLMTIALSNLMCPGPIPQPCMRSPRSRSVPPRAL